MWCLGCVFVGCGLFGGGGGGLPKRKPGGGGSNVPASPQWGRKANVLNPRSSLNLFNFTIFAYI